jgi:hypothetical protein
VTSIVFLVGGLAIVAMLARRREVLPPPRAGAYVSVGVDDAFTQPVWAHFELGPDFIIRNIETINFPPPLPAGRASRVRVTLPDGNGTFLRPLGQVADISDYATITTLAFRPGDLTMQFHDD